MLHTRRAQAHLQSNLYQVLRTRRFSTVILFLLFALSGCNLPRGTSVPPEDTILIYTQAAETLSAQLTALVTSTPMSGLVETSQVQGLPTSEQPGTIEATPTVSPTPTATPTPSPTPSQPAELVFQEDFSQENHWYTEQNSRFSLELSDGGYKIAINIKNAPIWSIRDQTFDDVIVEVDTSRLSGAKSGYSGLVCRHQDGDNYYALVVSPDGTYGIAKMQDGEFEFIQEGSDQSGVIKSGAANRVRAECIGETLSLYANDQLLLQVQDDNFSSGSVGLLAGTRKEVPFEAFFDNFAIYQP